MPCWRLSCPGAVLALAFALTHAMRLCLPLCVSPPQLCTFLQEQLRVAPQMGRELWAILHRRAKLYPSSPPSVDILQQAFDSLVGDGMFHEARRLAQLSRTVRCARLSGFSPGCVLPHSVTHQMCSRVSWGYAVGHCVGRASGGV